MASLFNKSIPKNLGVNSDDAKQFKLFCHSLCWVHEERHIRKIVPVDEQMLLEIEGVMVEFWELYRDLKLYKETPSEDEKVRLDRRFDDLFLRRTTLCPTLNKCLRMAYEKKSEMLLVLDRPETPLHNNSSETIARAAVIKRKVSGGTRSDECKRCRDTFLSLKITCTKLGISFSAYFRDRLLEAGKFPLLLEIILQRSAQPCAP
jgi:hypothetical protein